MEWFTTYVEMKGFVKLGNDKKCDILGVGDAQLKFQNGSTLVHKNVTHVPAIWKSFICIRKLDDAGYVTMFGSRA